MIKRCEIELNTIEVAKVLNNNVIIATHPAHGEVVVIGKGIGFKRKQADIIPLHVVEKMFILTNNQEQEQYKQLVPQVDEKLIEVIHEATLYIRERTNVELNEHIHIALTDHLAFAIKRMEQQMVIHNPFLYETKEIYPLEYELAENVIDLIKERLNVEFPQDEVGFIALHIHSALTNQHITQVKEHPQLIADMVNVIEKQLNYSVARDSLDYARLITHLRFAIGRIHRGDQVNDDGRLEMLLQQEYPELYSLAWKLIKIMEQRLHKPVYHAEISYLTMHLHRVAPPRNE